MKLLTTKQIREADEYTILNEPVSSIDLMERAAGALADWFTASVDKRNQIKIFSGTGNNGGDGLALARLLSAKGYNTAVFIVQPGSGFSPDATVNLERIRALDIPLHTINTEKDLPAIHPAEIVVDALFGTGLSRPVTGLPGLLIDHLNSLSSNIISIDIPSGLFGDDNRKNSGGSIIRAKHTLTFHFPKLAFFFRENRRYTGDWLVLPIGLHPDFIRDVQTPWYMSDIDLVKPLLKERDKFDHKGVFGHCLLISGSYGKMGAAVLAAKGCLRAGAGLLTVHVPARGCEIVQASVPEAMISLDLSGDCFSSLPVMDKYDAIGAGPALGTSGQTVKAVRELLISANRPLVLDADALNVISANREMISMIPENSILTPHPGEFDRLAGQHKNSHERLITQIELAKRHKVVIVLKGAYTSVVTPGGTCYFNGSGNPGMATAGSGDVLTGILLSLLGQGYKPSDAAVAGVFLHGLAGDHAVSVQSPEAMIAGDICASLGMAYKLLK